MTKDEQLLEIIRRLDKLSHTLTYKDKDIAMGRRVMNLSNKLSVIEMEMRTNNY
jgi:hypothetical protein